MGWTFVQETFNSSSAWTAPATISGSVTAEVWGSGGSGATVNTNKGGGGGGGGAYSRGATAIGPGEAHAVSVGSTAYTLSSGSSLFSTSATVFARGGRHGVLNNQYSNPGGLSAQGVGNLARYSGGIGSASGATYSGGGGEGSSTAADGSNAIGVAGGTGTDGGDGGNGKTSKANGDPGIAPGGGGGGGFRTTSSTYYGGAGAIGKVVLSYYLYAPDIVDIPMYDLFVTVDGDE